MKSIYNILYSHERVQKEFYKRKQLEWYNTPIKIQTHFQGIQAPRETKREHSKRCGGAVHVPAYTRVLSLQCSVAHMHKLQGDVTGCLLWCGEAVGAGLRVPSQGQDDGWSLCCRPA